MMYELVEVVEGLMFWGAIVWMVHLNLENSLSKLKLNQELELKKIELEIIKLSSGINDDSMVEDVMIEDKEETGQIGSEGKK